MADLVYKANDGSIHSNLADAEHRDNYVSAVYRLRSKFVFNKKAEEFIQRTSSEVDMLIRETRIILSRYHGENSEIVNRWDKNPRGFVGRILNDSNAPAEYLYWLLMSIDKRNRQWQQPYFSNAANEKIDQEIGGTNYY